MAGMDLSARRHDRGMSVFWMILIVGAGVAVLIAILLFSASAEQPQEMEAVENSSEVVTPSDVPGDQVEPAGAVAPAATEGAAGEVTDESQGMDVDTNMQLPANPDIGEPDNPPPASDTVTPTISGPEGADNDATTLK